MRKIAFIGTGAMGGAILAAACQGMDPGRITLTDAMPGRAAALAEEYGCHAVSTNAEAAHADMILLCVKPQTGAEALREIAPVLLEAQKAGRPKVLCSILAGVTIDTLRGWLGVDADYPIIRMMPNTPALIGKGLMLLTCDDAVSEGDKGALLDLIAPCGVSEWLSEKLFDQATALSGCTPAFVYMFIEALADGGVSVGVPRGLAMEFAARAVYGAAAMVLETGEHPGTLKDMVCSPGGSTIAGVAALEDGGFRTAAISAIQQAAKRNGELGEMK